MLLRIGVGYFLQRRFGLDMPTLVRLNFWLIVPAMIYCSVVESPLGADRIGQVAAFHLALMAMLGGASWGLGALRGVPRDQRRTLLMGTIFYNSGNYGLPLQDLAYRHVGRGAEAASLQVFVMVIQNLVSFTVGILLISGHGRAAWRRNVAHVVRFPPLYAIAAGLLTVAIRHGLGDGAPTMAQALAPFWDALKHVQVAFVAVALVTLGAQLALVAHDPERRYPVSLSVMIRLLLAPALGLLLIYLFGLRGFMAQVMLISTGMPTAVNAMLLCMEFDAHPNFIARTVFYSTLISPITVTLTIFLAQSGLLDRLATG
jgi:hypothetical protein